MGKWSKIFVHKESGMTLIEVLIAIVLLGIIGAAFAFSMAGATKADILSNTRTQARSFATSQMDAIKVANYVYAPSGGIADYTFTGPPANYQDFHVATLDRNNNPVDDHIYGIPWDNASNNVYLAGSNPIDSGLQKVTVIIKYNNKEIFRLVDFKVNR